tara:strand:- start:170 stop:541 length:372 start_codon:yes stop_codon:yes gene_type:complete
MFIIKGFAVKNKLLNFTLVILIVLQSFVAIANSQEIHELDVQHIQIEHSHESDDQVVDNDLSTDNEHNVKDCHHCGHCHGFHTQWLVQTQIFTERPNQIGHQYGYLFQYSSPLHDNPIIPPIS